jgi:hypothetical protein
MKDAYLLIANHIRDLHHSLTTKILTSKTHSPSWKISQLQGEDVVDELFPFLGLASLLEKMGNPQPPPSPLPIEDIVE